MIKYTDWYTWWLSSQLWSRVRTRWWISPRANWPPKQPPNPPVHACATNWLKPQTICSAYSTKSNLNQMNDEISNELASNQMLLRCKRKKNHWFACMANQRTIVKDTLFSSVPPSNSLACILNPWRTFWTTAPFEGPQLASCIASRTTENQGYR